VKKGNTSIVGVGVGVEVGVEVKVGVGALFTIFVNPIEQRNLPIEQRWTKLERTKGSGEAFLTTHVQFDSGFQTHHLP